MYVLQSCLPLQLQELVEDEPNPEKPDILLSSSLEQLSLSPIQYKKVQEFRHKLRDCELYFGVGLIWDPFSLWKLAIELLSLTRYKIINDLPVLIEGPTFFATIAQSIAPYKPHASPTVAESADSPPFVMAVFVSGISLFSRLLNIRGKKVDIIDDIIQPFLPQSAPHLQHIPKLFFIIALHPVDPHVPPPQFPEDPDGNYCIIYHVIGMRTLVRDWAEDITNRLIIRGMTVQEAIEKSRFHLINEDEGSLYYFTCLKKNLVLKK